MARTHFRILYREFLLRLVDLELFSPHARGDANVLFGQFAAVLILLSVVFTAPAIVFDNHMPPEAFLFASLSAQHFLISTTMLVVGVFAVLSWNSTFPEKQDVLVLAPLPVRMRTIFLAKVAAVGSGLAIAVLALQSLAGLVWPFALNKQMPAFSYPALTSQAAIAPLDAASLQSVMDSDMCPMLASGALAPGTNGGMVIGISKRGVRKTIAYGTASTDSIFEIGSIGKTFTALLLARMAEEGKVKLDEPVRLLLPEDTVGKPFGEEIRLLDLATHHSGLPRMPDNLHDGNPNQQFADYHEADLYAYLAHRGLRRPKGSAFEYSNVGFGLLGHALAQRAGMSYADLLQREVTGPLGMRDTVMTLSAEQQLRFARGYDGHNHEAPPLDLDVFAGAGGIRSTVADLLTYLEANLHPEKSGLAVALRSEQAVRAEADGGMRIALAWFYDSKSGVYSHDGLTLGYSSNAYFDRRSDTAVVVLFNHCQPLTSALVAEHIHQRLAGEPALSLGNIDIPASGGLLRLIRSFVVYWVTMFAAGAFVFCCVLGVQGLAAQLPRRYALRISPILQIAVFCLLVSVYFLEPNLAPPGAIARAQGSGLLSWSPTFWFLGLYQQWMGSPALAELAVRAWIGLIGAGLATVVSYVLAYVRTMRRIVEEPDLLPAKVGGLPWFGAIVEFSVRTLFRSRQHRVILAFYLGIAFAITIFLLKSPAARDPWEAASVPLLVATILMTAFAIVGLRIAFGLPLNFPAHWIFRVTPVESGTRCLAAYRQALWILAAGPALVCSAVLLLWVWPWAVASKHLLVLGLLASALVELCAQGYNKIPFACSWLPGRSNFHITSILCAALVLQLVLKGADFERRAFEHPRELTAICAILGCVALCARWRVWSAARTAMKAVEFDGVPEWQMVTLELPKDGGLEVEGGIDRFPAPFAK